MRLYERSIDFDLMHTINRCYFDADHGRIKLALDRLRDLEMELGENPKIHYTEGMLRKDSLKQGVKAFECYVRALELDPTYENAAVNAAVYAPNEGDFRKYAEIASRFAPMEAVIFKKQISTLDEGYYPYWQKLISTSAEVKGNPELGAVIDLALSSTTLPPEVELDFRRERFQILRNLDSVDQTKRESMGEFFPDDERLALHEALEEIDKAIKLDPFDATFWNYKAAWHRLLGRYEESLKSADEAIKLRPKGYHLPYHNKAVVLAKLGRRSEAIACAQEALRQIEVSDKKDDIPTIQKLIADLNSPTHAVTWEDILPRLMQIVETAQITAVHEINLIKGLNPNRRASVKEMIDLVKRGIHDRHPSPDNAMDYVPGMAELLSYFGPEILFVTLYQILLTDNISFQNCLKATLYIAAHADKIMQRDALRLLILTVFINAIPPGNGKTIRDQYRRVILDVSAVATDEMANLDQLMRKELERIHPDLPRLIADQEPSDDEGRAKARRLILSKLQGTPFIVNSKDKSTHNTIKNDLNGKGYLPLLAGIICCSIFGVIGWSSGATPLTIFSGATIGFAVGLIGSFILGAFFGNTTNTLVPRTLSEAQKVLDDLRRSPASKVRRAVKLVADCSTDERDVKRLIQTFFMDDYDLKRETALALGRMFQGKGMARNTVMSASYMTTNDGQRFLAEHDAHQAVLSSVRKALWREMYFTETDNHPAYKEALNQALVTIFGVQRSIPLPNDLFDEEYKDAKRAFEEG